MRSIFVVIVLVVAIGMVSFFSYSLLQDLKELKSSTDASGGEKSSIDVSNSPSGSGPGGTSASAGGGGGAGGGAGGAAAGAGTTGGSTGGNGGGGYPSNFQYCSEEERNAENCNNEQVCGWLNPESVNCEEETCVSRGTYSNSCEACSNHAVIGYSPGDCPVYWSP